MLKQSTASLLFALISLFCAQGAAQPLPRAPSHPPEMEGAGVLVLGVSVQRDAERGDVDFDPRARTAIQTHISTLFRTARVLTTALKRDDLGCRSLSCWTSLSASHQADYILTADISDLPARYSAEVALADRQGNLIKVDKKDCSQCTDEQKGKTLLAAIDALFTAEVPDAPLPSILPPPVPPPARLCPQPWNFERGIATGASAAFLFTGLFTAVSLSALDGKVYADDAQRRLTYELGPHQGLFFGLSGLSALSLGLSLGVGHPAQDGLIRCPEKGACPAAEGARSGKASAPASERALLEGRICREPPHTRRTFFRGVALGALGGMFVSSLLATATFGALHGGSSSSASGATTTYSMVGPTAASGTLAGLSAVGFLLAFPW
jgi:hypothetical protein